MSVVEQYKSFSASRPWTTRILLTLFVLLILLALIRASMPLVIKVGANSWFEDNNIEATIGDIEIALIGGSFAISDVSGTSDTGKNFSLGRLSVSWQWEPLFDNIAIVDSIEISKLKADAAFYKNGDMNIAGLVIKAAADEAPVEEPAPETGEPAKPWDATVKNIKLSDIEFCMQQYTDGENPTIDYCAALGNFAWNGDISFKASEQDRTPDSPPLYISGTLGLNDIALNNNQLKLSLLSIDGINIENINIETPMNVNIDEVGINKLIAMQRKPGESTNDAQVAGFDSLTIKPITLSQLNNLKLGTIQLDGTQAFIRIDENGKTDFAQWIPEKQAEEQPEAKEAETESKPFHYALDAFIFNTSNHFVFIDDSLKESFKVDVHDVTLKFEKLDSQKPGDTSHVNLALAIDEHGSFKVDSDLTPLAKRPTVKGKGEIAGLDLRTFAPFTKQHIGHNIRSGQLDADLKLAIDKGIIDSNMGLALRHFELKALSKKEAEELNSEFGLPLNSSLSLLRDKDNTIQLDIPVTGDIDNPEFDPNDAIFKATSSAITAAVLHYYTPFGLVFAAESLFDLATALSFEPVVYEAGASKLNSAHEEQLTKLATLMAERPGIHLTLCGISNNSDKDKLFPAPPAPKKTDTEQVSKTLSKTQIAELKKVAEARSSGVKNYLVNKKKIKASRLVECAPEFEADNEVAGVAISI